MATFRLNIRYYLENTVNHEIHEQHEKRCIVKFSCLGVKPSMIHEKLIQKYYEVSDIQVKQNNNRCSMNFYFGGLIGFIVILKILDRITLTVI
jgi:hypothetical protein